MLKGLVVGNGIGSEQYYPNRNEISYTVQQIDARFALQLDGYDVLIIPNGTDHVALYRERQTIRRFLEQGKVLLCCCGWFLDWVPGNRWIHDNSKPTRDMRHIGGRDPLGLLQNVDLAKLDTNEHDISGWWACGFIEPAAGADVVLHDTWGRAVIVSDSVSTPGLMILTASGPIGDSSAFGYSAGPIQRLYENFIQAVITRQQQSNAARILA